MPQAARVLQHLPEMPELLVLLGTALIVALEFTLLGVNGVSATIALLTWCVVAVAYMEWLIGPLWRPGQASDD